MWMKHPVTSWRTESKAVLKNYGAFLNDTVTSHEITLMDRSYSEVVDTNLWTYKYDRVNSIVSMQERIDTLKGELTAESAKYY